MSRIAIVVTHLLGTGHLARALVLARALKSSGHTVRVISGGMPVGHLDTSGIQFVQLPPLRSDGLDFSNLLTDQWQTADKDYRANRTAALCESLSSFEPHALITELFPFGRRNLADEFLTALDCVQQQSNPPQVFCSIRDILAPPSKPSKAERTHDIIARYYDAVLVHSDPNVTPLNVSWPVDDQLSQKLVYTGFVANPPAGDHPDQSGSGEVLVTAGGGGVGDDLFTAALDAAALDSDRIWRLLVGGTEATSRCDMLKNKAPSNAVVEPARTDFRQMLRHAAASVSMCGYNTAMDLLQSATPAVLVPFDAGSEVEQGLRAGALSLHNGFETLLSADMTPRRLLAAVDKVIQAPQRSVMQIQLDGADKTAQIITTRLNEVPV